MRKAAFLLAMLSLPSLANANLVTNGSFEADVQANGSWGIYNNLTGWVGVNNVELRNNVSGVASDGVNYVELDTNANNSIFQMVSTTAGSIYDLSFDYSPREGVTSQSNPIKAFWNGSLLSQITGSGIGKNGNNWYTISFSVMGTGSDKLSFAATGLSDGFGGSLDNVSLVPEPGIWSSLSAGLMLIGFMAFRRKTKS
ncbi:PEP-CTERM sorting domain-containing protein [Methylotenera sp. L2L1]|uniref:PEP-CTERM sorting domain-containing protein n=1 Tax=Methylotenera sp. L2L1 TaxID=1502770 RepID=UPI00055BF158|nr:PEP-CTERM sorting domain-containing protein [Methylotenera sp. L2L1]